MSRAPLVAGTSLALALAVLALLLAALSIAVSRWDGLLFYGGLSLGGFALVTWLLRRDRLARVAETALLPAELRPAPRRPRQPIRLPLRAAALTFTAWYLASLVVSVAVNGRLIWLDFVAIAPFASFTLTVLTFAGRHIAFRLTAEERDD